MRQNPLVEAFSRAYAAAGPDQQAALRVWMRNIILPGIARRDDLARARRSEKESVAARDRRILEFPLSMSYKAMAKKLRAEGWYSPKTSSYHIKFRIIQVRARAQRETALNGWLRFNFQALKDDWRKHVVASSGYRDLGMFDDAADALEEIEPEDKTRKEVLGALVDLYMPAKKWDMAAAVASHLGEGRARRSRLVDQSGVCDTPS